MTRAEKNVAGSSGQTSVPTNSIACRTHPLPEVLFELADVDYESARRRHRIGGRGIDEFELWRADQRDARLFVPFATQLKESPAFRARVRNLPEELAS